MALIICAFPGSPRQGNPDLTYLNGTNYTKLLQNNFSEEEIVIVPSSIRQTLEELGIDYVVVFPSLGLKEEYLERYEDKKLKGFMEENWEDLICEIQVEDYSNRIILGKGKYVEDIIEVVKRVGYKG